VKRILIAAALAALALPASAGAHSVVRIGGDAVNYLSVDATSLNTLTGRMAGGRIELRDRTVDGGIDPGTCDPGEITPDANAWIIQVFCSRQRIARLNIDLGEREDSASISVPMPVTLLGGPGSDRLQLGPGDDRLQGDDGNDEVAGGGGDDVLDGGLGYDRLDGGDGGDRLVSADGLADRVLCGAGADRVEADTVDDVAGDCETIDRRPVVPPADAGATLDDQTAPVVQAGGKIVQRLGRRSVKVLATSSERGFLAASGFLNVGGISLPLQSDRRRVPVAGGGATLTVKLTSRHVRRARRALRRGGRPSIRMFAVATDLAGNSQRARAVRIRLRS
jgi:RTX calcium-binding nonapeptide repeat (4 copies)